MTENQEMSDTIPTESINTIRKAVAFDVLREIVAHNARRDCVTILDFSLLEKVGLVAVERLAKIGK